MALVHVDHCHHVIGLQFFADRLIAREQFVQLVAPAAPIRPELQEHTLVLLSRGGQSVGNLFGGIGGFVVNAGTLCF